VGLASHWPCVADFARATNGVTTTPNRQPCRPTVIVTSSLLMVCVCVCVSATGCPDYKSSVDGGGGSVWVRYSSDRQTAEVGCSHRSTTASTRTWQLVCRDGEWTGYVDHCSPPGTAYKIPREQFPRNFVVAGVTGKSCVLDALRGCHNVVARKLPTRHVCRGENTTSSTKPEVHNLSHRR